MRDKRMRVRAYTHTHIHTIHHALCTFTTLYMHAIMRPGRECMRKAQKTARKRHRKFYSS